MNDRTTASRPVVWAAAAVHGSAIGVGNAADRRAFDAFDVQGCLAAAHGTASNANANEASSSAQSTNAALPAQLDALSKGPQPALIKTGLPRSAAELRALVQCVDRLRAQDPLLAWVVDADAHVPAATADRGLLDACIDELLPRATLVTLSVADAAAWLGRSPIVDDVGLEDAARNLQRRSGCRGVVIHRSDASGSEAGRDFMLTEQAGGWLSPVPAAAAEVADATVAQSIATGAHADAHRAWFSASAAAALARGFVPADAAVLASMATTHLRRRGRSAEDHAEPVDADRRFALDPRNLPGLTTSPAKPPIRFAPLLQPQMDLYAVVDSAAWVRRVLDGGVRTVQLRIKDPAHPALREEIRASVAAAKTVKAQLFVNDHWQLAIEENAYGVHLGQEDLATADLPRLAAAGVRLGISTHAYWEVCRATALRPSYIACGPIHPTAAKAMPWIPQGNDNLGYWCALLREPVVAIAGMDFERAAQAVQRGADAVAVISGITAADSPEQAMQGFADSIAQARRLSPLASSLLPRPTLARTA